MRYLLFGGCGFIGTHLKDFLVAQRADVSIIDRRPERFRELDRAVNYEISQGELTTAGKAMIRDADVVVYLASSMLPGGLSKPLHESINDELRPLLAVLENIENSAAKFVYISSGGAIYGDSNDHRPSSEDRLGVARSPYGVAKAVCESVVRYWCSDRSLPYVVLRPSNPYGEFHDPQAGQGVVGIFLNRIAKRSPLEVLGDGSSVKDYIYIEDLVRGIYLASITDTTGMTINLGSGVGTSVNELLRVLSEVTGTNPTIVRKPERRGDVRYNVLDIALAQAVLGWRPSVSLQDGLSRVWRYVSQKIDKT